ncbi:MAG: HAD family hydrolase [Clostridia bacterium]|nr:HAD family hydrolase [Clostridia bacterium]
MIHLCIFDLDGTTINSLRSIAYFANETLKRFGYAPFQENAYRHLAGGGANALWNNICREAHVPLSRHDEMMHDWLRTYEQDFTYLTQAYDGVADMLLALKKKGIVTAIVTNKAKAIADKLCRTFFDESMLDEIISDHPGMVLKPAPDELIRLMQKYGVSGADTLYCGDHTIDMVTGKNAGARTVGVTWGFHTAEALRDAGADYIANVPQDIVTIATNQH